MNEFPWGYLNYNDVIRNRNTYSLSELNQLKNGDRVLILNKTDSDDDYSLESRLYEEIVSDVSSDGIVAGDFFIDLLSYSSEYFLVVHPKR